MDNCRIVELWCMMINIKYNWWCLQKNPKLTVWLVHFTVWRIIFLVDSMRESVYISTNEYMINCNYSVLVGDHIHWQTFTVITINPVEYHKSLCCYSIPTVKASEVCWRTFVNKQQDEDQGSYERICWQLQVVMVPFTTNLVFMERRSMWKAVWPR